MFERVKKILVDTLNVDEAAITPEAELEKDLGINSLDVYELVVNFEEEFNIEIEDEAARTFVTVEDIVKFLEKEAA
jgi:acyl carrier protein